jgi:hypothetical protein
LHSASSSAFKSPLYDVYAPQSKRQGNKAHIQLNIIGAENLITAKKVLLYICHILW